MIVEKENNTKWRFASTPLNDEVSKGRNTPKKIVRDDINEVRKDRNPLGSIFVSTDEMAGWTKVISTGREDPDNKEDREKDIQDKNKQLHKALENQNVLMGQIISNNQNLHNAMVQQMHLCYEKDRIIADLEHSLSAVTEQYDTISSDYKLASIQMSEMESTLISRVEETEFAASKRLQRIRVENDDLRKELLSLKSSLRDTSICKSQFVRGSKQVSIVRKVGKENVVAVVVFALTVVLCSYFSIECERQTCENDLE